MALLIIWVIIAILVGLVGSERVIGFWGAFLWSVLLSPVIGLIITLFSESMDSYRRKQQIARDTKQQTEILQQMALKTNKTNQGNLAEELAKWKKQADDGLISQDEYQKIKNKILAQFD